MTFLEATSVRAVICDEIISATQERISANRPLMSGGIASSTLTVSHAPPYLDFIHQTVSALVYNETMLSYSDHADLIDLYVVIHDCVKTGNALAILLGGDRWLFASAPPTQPNQRLRILLPSKRKAA